MAAAAAVLGSVVLLPLAALADSVVDTIAVGSGAYSAAFTPDGTTAYVANFDDNTVSVISTATGVDPRLSLALAGVLAIAGAVLLSRRTRS